MDDRWEPAQAARHTDPIESCVYGTRLIGSDPSLVLHGGGNSSVKAPYPDITGTAVDAIYVKGSGWDMATIEAAGLTPLRLGRVRDLLELTALSDPDMMRELDGARLDPRAPSPSVETLLHAFLPHPAVQHSHADAIVTLTNLADGADLVREVLGESVVVVPYVMPGFDLAREVRRVYPEQADSGTEAMVLLKHGLFTFGQTTEEAYRTHIRMIDTVERWLADHAPTPTAEPPALPSPVAADLARLRASVSSAAGRPMIMRRHADRATRRFVARADLSSVATRGPLTPDHVIRTKSVPMVGTDVDEYVRRYRQYVDENRSRARTDLIEIDPAPRLVLDPDLGLLAFGQTAKDARIAADICQHTMPVIERAEDHLGGYEALPPADLFDMEYWALEQAKLARRPPPEPLTGLVALVTGAASGIGRAAAAALRAAGACVVGLDRADGIDATFDGDDWLGVRVDVTDSAGQNDAVQAAVERFGGVDIAVAAAGAFRGTRPVAETAMDEWRDVFALNLDAVVDLLAVAHPLLALAPTGGRVVLIGSKNAPAPGRAAGAYSASKAALTQLGRLAALEWASDGIRVNVVHPDAVFDTGLWTDDVVEARARSYGMTVDEYKRRNLLGAEIRSEDVAAVVTALCSDTFRVTTGAQIPVDGGNERVI